MSDAFSVSATCSRCGEQLIESHSAPDASRLPCPKCGSVDRNVSVGFGEGTAARELYRVRVKSPTGPNGGMREVRDLTTGSRRDATGKFVEKLRDIDKTSTPSRYRERVVGEDGTVLHDVDEPLDEHRGHGSDKPSK